MGVGPGRRGRTGPHPFLGGRGSGRTECRAVAPPDCSLPALSPLRCERLVRLSPRPLAPDTPGLYSGRHAGELLAGPRPGSVAASFGEPTAVVPLDERSDGLSPTRSATSSRPPTRTTRGSSGTTRMRCSACGEMSPSCSTNCYLSTSWRAAWTAIRGSWMQPRARA